MISFEIKGLPEMFNKSKNKHWAVKAKHNKQWKEMVAIVLLQTQQRPPAPFKKAKVKLTRCSAAPPDFENLAQSFKPILDGLVEARVLVDDNMSVIGQPEYEWQRAKATEGKIIVTVWGEE